MKFKEIHFKNFGPIGNGTIQRHKINVFFGPNNSGKSLVSRLVHGINSLDVKKTRMPSFLLRKFRNSSRNVKFDLYMHTILNSAGIDYSDLTTFGKKNGHLEIKSTKPLLFKFSKGVETMLEQSFIVRHYLKRVSESSRQSVYIPAGRTGTIQFFTNITQVRNRLLGDLLNTFGERGIIRSGKASVKDIRKFTRSLSELPEHLEQFHDLILSSQADELDKNVQKLFSDLFSGSIEVTSFHGMPNMVYRDPTGFITEIESAGSGTVSSFPIVAGIYYVEPGGTLIIEEPEAHLEPSRQLKMIEALQTIAYMRKIDLVFTTHSDYVVKKILALVSKKKINRHDIGLYYFDRTPDTLTTIKKIYVDKTGEAEQPLFQEAMENLITEFTES